MEKAVEPLLGGDEPHRPSKPSRPRRLLPALLLTLLAALWFHDLSSFIKKSLNSREDDPSTPSTADELWTDWSTIKPSADLAWQPCFRAKGNFSCARLTVAMDPARPLSASAAHPKVHIALLLVPATEGRPSESPLLLNPGGPGGSGTSFALSAGAVLRTALNSSRDVLGFDPRGIGGTWPPADCFMEDYAVEEPPTQAQLGTALLHRLTWGLLEQEAGLPGSSDGALRSVVTHAKAVGRLCKERDSKAVKEGGEESVLRYAGTPHVAQDMKSIVEAWDRWRDGLKSDQVANGCHGGMKRASDEDVENGDAAATVTAASDEPPNTKGKLVYWGFSYGTFLGATFASMFPDMVGRLVLDGVVNSDIYFTRDGWIDSIRDIDTVLGDFFTTCLVAEKECALYRKGDQVDDIKGRFQSVMTKLEEEPFIAISMKSQMPALLTISMVRQILFSCMYFPMTTFPLAALIVNDLYEGGNLGGFLGAPDLAPFCSMKQALPIRPDDSATVIGCSDWRKNRNQTLDDYQEALENMGKRSSFADVFINIMTRCASWEIPLEDPPAMNWDRFPTGDRPPVNTSFPILWMSSSHDPVTPLQQALLMSQRFANSGLVEQQSDGHCSLSAVSLCSLGKIRAYLEDGVVPSPPELDSDRASDGTITGRWEKCKADEKPWKPYRAQEWLAQADGAVRTQEDVVRMDAWQQVQKAFQAMHPADQPPMAHNGVHANNLAPFMKLDYATAAAVLRSSREAGQQDIYVS